MTYLSGCSVGEKLFMPRRLACRPQEFDHPSKSGIGIELICGVHEALAHEPITDESHEVSMLAARGSRDHSVTFNKGESTFDADYCDTAADW